MASNAKNDSRKVVKITYIFLALLIAFLVGYLVGFDVEHVFTSIKPSNSGKPVQAPTRTSPGRCAAIGDKPVYGPENNPDCD